MTIGYTTPYDASVVGNWSGLGYFIPRALAAQGAEIDYIGSLKPPRLFPVRVRSVITQRVLKQGFGWDREPAVLGSYARQVEERLRSSKAQAVLAPGATTIARLKTDLPVFIWADATFAGLLNTYFFGLSARSIRNGHAMEQETFKRCRLAFFSSDWAARTAIELCGADPSKVIVAPFGANFETTRTKSEVEEYIAARSHEPCRLLFLGVDWERKGGAIAVEAARALNARGIPTTLDIVGCTPPVPVPDFVHCHGFISKGTPEGRQRLHELLVRATFLVFPSRAECYGLALVEACSFGTPVVASNVGGIPTIVRDGVNGQTLDPGADGGDYAAFIARTLETAGEYQRLALGAFGEYETRLNWQAAGKTVMDHLRRVVV